MSRELRTNERIRIPQVRVIDESGAQLGVMPTDRALTLARERGLDLVEVAPTADPPVCRILDFGKFKYEQSKREREARKNQKQVVLREVRMKPKIDEHDIAFKTRTAAKLLREGDKVKVSVMFRGREVTHPQIGRDLLARVYAELKDFSVIEKQPSLEGRFMTMILAPGAPPQRPKERPSSTSEPEPEPERTGATSA
ncbi:MAG TPA: translation initiation factor IF-3 [Dehalococcoidia bacterium]|nr:translation initiation factor IF-3 [Dehalococcoidia bacterium]